MAIKAPNFHDIVERPWVERAIGAAAATVFVAGVTAASTFGTAGIAPTLAAPAFGGRTSTAPRAVDVTTWTPTAFLDAGPGRSSGATRSRSAGTTGSRGTASDQPAVDEPRASGGGVDNPPPPPLVDDPKASDTDGPGLYVGAALGDAVAAIGADPNGAGATAGDTTVGSPPAEPASDGLTINVAPGGGVPPIAIHS